MPKYIASIIDDNIEELELKKSVLVCGLSYKTNVEDMRDSASFKIINELKTKGYQVYGYDLFFKDESLSKYLIENNLKEINFIRLEKMDDESLKNIDCICIVQHHESTKEKLTEIYKESKVPLLYDCQNKIKKIDNYKTTLKFLGA